MERPRCGALTCRAPKGRVADGGAPAWIGPQLADGTEPGLILFCSGQDTEFFTPMLGYVERLPSENTLITTLMCARLILRADLPFRDD